MSGGIRRRTIRSEIQTMSGRVATAPEAEFHFHRQRES
jgi:hypothetical protein